MDEYGANHPLESMLIALKARNHHADAVELAVTLINVQQDGCDGSFSATALEVKEWVNEPPTVSCDVSERLSAAFMAWEFDSLVDLNSDLE